MRRASTLSKARGTAVVGALWYRIEGEWVACGTQRSLTFQLFVRKASVKVSSLLLMYLLYPSRHELLCTTIVTAVVTAIE